MAKSLIFPLLVSFSLASPACDCGGSTELCVPGQTACIDLPEYVLVCAADGQLWETRLCPGSDVCYRGNCHDLTCAPGSSRCEGLAVAHCLEDGSAYAASEDCDSGLVCVGGTCVHTQCQTGQRRCAGTDTVEQCAAPGLQWVFERRCDTEQICQEGACLLGVCENGDTECGPTTRFVCDQGNWQAEPCGVDRACLFGTCVTCVADDNCDPGQRCFQGGCRDSDPVILTQDLPSASVAQPYAHTLQADGGAPEYTWSVASGAPPAGIQLSRSGELRGTPTESGAFVFDVRVEDSLGQHDQVSLSLQVIADGPLSVVTSELPAAEHGLPYSASLQASGGVQAYAWQLLAGPLPLGMDLWSRGEIVGVPEEIGDFRVTLRVVDASTPPALATAELILHVEIAPLAITGERSYNLLFTRVVVLPTLIQLVPYSAQLEVQGGLPPYTWTQQDPPSGLGWLISTWGLPDGLTLSADGQLSGWVTDVSDASTVQIPFGPSLTGYFIYAGVDDSQNPADNDAAIFLLPTVPLSTP